MMVLWMILLVVATIALCVWLVRTIRPDSSHAEASTSPQDTARNRYARGEIDEEQYAAS